MTTASMALRIGVQRLRHAGIEGAERDARRLLAEALDTTPGRLSVVMHDEMPAGSADRYSIMISRRSKRVPVSHILGYRHFWKSRFKITSDVLDPRPETERLVEIALQAPFDRVLDLGTGSGAILISLLLERPKAKGIGTDISEKAVLIAGENADALGVADRITLPISDWFDDVGSKYDLIVSNPPYIAAEEIPILDEDVRLFEPARALTDGADGLTGYRSIAKAAADHLRPGGRLLVEIGATQAKAVSALFQGNGFPSVEVFQDLDGRDRVVRASIPA